jgi:hypothetical protein
VTVADLPRVRTSAPSPSDDARRLLSRHPTTLQIVDTVSAQTARAFTAAKTVFDDVWAGREARIDSGLAAAVTTAGANYRALTHHDDELCALMRESPRAASTLRGMRDVFRERVSTIEPSLLGVAELVVGARRMAQARAPTSRQSLDAFIDEVSQAPNHYTEEGGARLYERFARCDDVDSSEPPQALEMIERLRDLAVSRPATLSEVQGFDISIADAAAALRRGVSRRGEDQLYGAFYAVKRDEDTSSRTQRIYLNPRAANAVPLFEWITRHVVDDRATYPGVCMAKISGPDFLPARVDKICIYTEDDEATKRVTAAVLHYAEQHPRTFLPSVPPTTRQIARGIAIGDEPSDVAVSYGQKRMGAIHRGLRRQLRGEDAREAIYDELSRAGVSRSFPHRNS